MSPHFEGQVAVVTGASGGVGTALVPALLGAGTTVIATSRGGLSSAPASRNAADQTDSGTASLHVRELDVSDLGSLKPFVRQVGGEFGRVDLRPHNAGTAPVQRGYRRTLRLGRPDEVATFAVAMPANAYLIGRVALLDGRLHPRCPQHRSTGCETCHQHMPTSWR